MSEYDIRLAPAINMSDEHIKDFAVRSLWSTLKGFQCGPFEATDHIEWFWKTAPTWRPTSTQKEFDVYARERISDHVGYTRKRADAWHLIDELFADTRYDDIGLDRIVKAITLLVPTEPFPFDVFENGKTSIVDLTKRSDSPKLLKIDSTFLPILKELYPWERDDDSIIKRIPIGTVERELNLITLPFLLRYPDAERAEWEGGYDFHNPDRLDWTSGNLYSFWREGPRAAAFQDRFWGMPTERVNPNGDLVLDTPPSTVIVTDSRSLANVPQPIPFDDEAGAE